MLYEEYRFILTLGIVHDLYRRIGMKSDLIAKLIESTQAGHTAETLSTMPGSVLHTLLMEVFTERTKKLSPASIDMMYNQNRLVAPCPVDQVRLVRTDALAYEILDRRFCGIELSPVMPLGVNAVLGGVNQRNVLGAARSCEALADPTTALALEGARRRKTLLAKNLRDPESIRLATSARCMRLQRFDNIPGFVPHFKIFALATAGRDTGSEVFEIESLREHLSFYLDYISALQSDGYGIRDVHVELSDVRIMRAIVRHHELDSADIGHNVQMHDSSVFKRYGIQWPRTAHSIGDLLPDFVREYGIEKTIALLSKLGEHVVEPLRRMRTSVHFSIDLDRAAGMNYYTNACFKIWAINETGERYPLVDGGFSDWTQKLLQSRKERLFTSGIGTELILANFR